MKSDDSFAEDRHLMSREPVSDYGFVFRGWNPFPDYSHTTEWDEVGGEVEFRVWVRKVGGAVDVTVRMPKLETKEGKQAFTAAVRQQIVKGLETK